ncbi:MAG: lysylphosphatidylglycerol synthase transmembrane domain-containing protein [Solitalea-like symbiont of Acarus siro]
MKKTLKYIKYLFCALIGIALLSYVFKAQSVANIFRLIVTSNIYLLIISTIVFFIAHIFRASRWQILIETFDIKPSKSMLYNAIMSSLLVNIFIIRFGEIYRCYLINKTDQLPVSTLIGTVVTERIIDLFSLLVIILTVVLTNYQLSANYFNEHILQKIAYNQILVIGSGLSSILLISVLSIFLLYKYKRENYIALKVKNFLKGLYKGVLSITKIKQKLAFFINTVLIWFCYWLFTYIITLAFPATNNLSPITSILILALSGISMA